MSVNCSHAPDGVCVAGHKCQPVKDNLRCPRMEQNTFLNMLNPACEVVMSWAIEDVQDRRPDLNDEQAFEVLERVIHKHDAEMGISWDTITYHADDLFPQDTKTYRYVFSYNGETYNAVTNRMAGESDEVMDDRVQTEICQEHGIPYGELVQEDVTEED